MAGNKKGAEGGRIVNQHRRDTRMAEVVKNDLGKGEKPGFGTGAWAREHKLWKDGDTEGPAPKADPR